MNKLMLASVMVASGFLSLSASAASASNNASDTKDKATPAAVAPVTTNALGEETIILSPFEVTARDERAAPRQKNKLTAEQEAVLLGDSPTLKKG